MVTTTEHYEASGKAAMNSDDPEAILSPMESCQVWLIYSLTEKQTIVCCSFCLRTLVFI